MKNCTNCGAPLDDEAVFCTSCGSEQQAAQPQAPAQPQPQYQPPQYQPQPQYQQPYNQPAPTNGVAIAGMVCGLLGLIFCWVPILGLVLSIVGIVCGAKGRTAGVPYGKTGMGTAGLVLGIIGAVFSFIYLIIWIVSAATVGTVASNYDNFWKYLN